MGVTASVSSSRRLFAGRDQPAKAVGKLAGLAGIFLILLAPAARAFDYDRYQPADIDVISARKPPAGLGVDVFPAKFYRFEVTLASQAAPCQTKFLKWAMQTSGINKEAIEKAPITHCIQIKSAKGKRVTMFIQDVLAGSLAQEAPTGGKLTLYAMLIYFDQNGPGVVVSEFSGQNSNASDQKANADCGCGTQFHSGSDFEAKEGTPVPVLADGIVVKIEQDELATVDTPTAGKCGRYVVVKHTFPNGRVAYSRYAQLGRLVDKAGKPISVGLQVKAKDSVGEVGSTGRFHFEVRPIESATMDRSPEWSQRYGADLAMDWSRYAPVDPAKFEPAEFDKKGTAADKK